jgi:hypothetical protein
MCLFPPPYRTFVRIIGVLVELSSARDEKDDAVVIGAGIYRKDVLFQMWHVCREIHALKGNDRVRNACC